VRIRHLVTHLNSGGDAVDGWPWPACRAASTSILPALQWS